MANVFDNLSANAAQLKIFYQGPIVDQLNQDLPIYRAAEKIKKGWSGLQVNRPLRVRRNQGVGATSDGGNLPSIGRQTTVQAIIQAKFNYLRFGITGPMIAASQSDVGSFVRSAGFELEQGYQDLRNELNRQLYWDGTGTLATVSANAVASTSVTATGRESTEAGNKFLDVGAVIDFYTTAGVAVAQGITVTAISTSGLTATLTLDQPVTVSATNIIVRSGAYNQEVQGLVYALDGLTTSVYSVDRSLYPAYQGNVLNAAAGQLTLDLMQQSFNEGLRRGGQANGTYSAIMADFDSVRYYQKLLTADKRYTNTTEGDGSFGVKGKFYMNFNGIPVVPDKDCPTRFFFLPMNVLEFYLLKEMAFADEQGSMYFQQISTDAYEVRVRHFGNLFNAQPSACAVLRNYISP